MEDVFLRHQLRIARRTLTLSDVGARIMGGMTKEEARRILREQGTAADRRLVDEDEAGKCDQS